MSSMIKACLNIFPKKIDSEERTVYDIYVASLINDYRLKGVLKRVS